jgi:Tol biopolymer transport system component
VRKASLPAAAPRLADFRVGVAAGRLRARLIRLRMPEGTCCPRISPDETRLLVFRGDDPQSPTGTPATMVLDGSDYTAIPIADPTLNYIPQAWSSDGQRIAYEGWDEAHPSRNGIYTARVKDGGDIVRLTSVKGIHDIPADYTPDGKQMLFYRTAKPEPNWDLGGELWIMNTDGTDANRINTHGTMPSPYARWSPDGTKILFATARDQPTGELWTVDADGSNLTRLFEDNAGRFASGGEWSPNGAKIMFSLNPVANYWIHPINEIDVINADRTGLTPGDGRLRLQRRRGVVPLRSLHGSARERFLPERRYRGCESP